MQNARQLIASPRPSSGLKRTCQTFAGRICDLAQSGFESGIGILGYRSVKPAQTQASGTCRCESPTAEKGAIKNRVVFGHNHVGRQHG